MHGFDGKDRSVGGPTLKPSPYACLRQPHLEVGIYNLRALCKRSAAAIRGSRKINVELGREAKQKQLFLSTLALIYGSLLPPHRGQNLSLVSIRK